MPESNSPTPDIVECDSSSITASDNASLNWLRRLNNAERHTWFASSGGLALDAMDSQAYSLAIPSLLIALHLSTAQAGTFATAALVGSGIGGWLFGLLADRFGRIKMLQCSIVVVAVSTFLSAFATQFWHLLVARSLQGIGYGGEAAVGAVLVSEMIRPALRGRVTKRLRSRLCACGGVDGAYFSFRSGADGLEISLRAWHPSGVLSALHKALCT